MTEAGALESFQRYVAAFGTLDARAVVPHFHTPAMLISPQGVVAFASGDEVERFYRQFAMADLPAKGYGGTELVRVEERRLGADLAEVSGVLLWKTKGGQEMSRFGATYVLRRAAEGWKIVVAVIHDPA